MPRARNIKPSLFKNEVLGEADPLLTILFTGLWCLADRDGRMEDRPKRIKAEIFPYREISDFNRYLTELERLGFITRYRVNESDYIEVENFNKHQSPHKTEKASDIPKKPDPSKGYKSPVKEPLNNGSETVKESLIPDSGLPDSSNTDTKTAREKNQIDYSSWPELPDPQILKDWIAARKKAKATHSQTAINNIGKELHKAREKGFSVNDCLSEAVTRGWRGLKAEWMQNAQGQRFNGNGQPAISYDQNDTSWADDFNPNGGDFDSLV